MRKQSLCKEQDKLPTKSDSVKTTTNILTAVEVNGSNKTEKDFLIIEPCLGSGAYGSVSLVRDVNSRIQYARKNISKLSLQSQQSIDNLKREIRIQKKLCHPNILKLCHCYEDQNSVLLVLEYAEMGSLYQLIKRRQRIMEKEAYQYFIQTLKGLEYMHQMKIVHRDIKPENLLLTKSGQIKICDFGWATEMPNYCKAFCGTVEYMAPEMIQQQVTDYKSDIWSLGVLLYEMTQGHTPFSGANYIEKSQKILSRKQIEYHKPVTDECKSLIKLLLNYNLHSRPNFEEIKNHQWMLMQVQGRSSSMVPIRSEITIQHSTTTTEKSSVNEWEAMKFRSQQFQFQRQQDYQDKGFLIKVFSALGCINR